MLIYEYLLGFLFLAAGFQGSFATKKKTIKIQRGQTAVLYCPIDVKTCGELHSLNWFKGDTRIAVRLGNGTNIAPDYRDRVSIKSDEGPTTSLIINSIRVSDEGTYTCDPTFFIPQESCDSSGGYRIELKVTVPPTEVIMLDEKGDRISNGSTLGPLQEGYTLTTTCVVKRTRPPPEIAWYRNDERITTHSPTLKEEEELYTASLDLSRQLSRDDLAKKFECRVNSESLSYTVTNYIELDLQVRPLTNIMTGGENHTVQGAYTTLQCKVTGARPPADIVWTNSSDIIIPDLDEGIGIDTDTFLQNDGTIDSISTLKFTSSRFENGRTFRCEADNIVMRQYREKPIHAFRTLDVFYEPVVKVSPPYITANVTEPVLLQCEYEANPTTLLNVKWYKDDEYVDIYESRFKGGTPENAALSIESTTRKDRGNYTCELTNSVGTGTSPIKIELDVQYVPIVEVVMVPEGPVIENDETNVTLYCNIIDGNPGNLVKVRWYANSTLLKELPDCNETTEDLCHVDPSKLLLESIGRGFFYNYSCEGYNSAGWGPRSPDKELVVYYEPGPATLSHYPIVAIKKKSVTFSCTVGDPGYPPATKFHWLLGGRNPKNVVTSKDWTIDPVVLDHRTNFTCSAYNDGGHGTAATVELDVHAPPFFIKSLVPYTGVLHSTKNASLMCRVECVPRCSISWYKDGILIDPKSDKYFVHETYLPADPGAGDFESVLSVLHFNISAWPNQAFDIHKDNANYSCISSNNSAGNGVRSGTYFSIEYAPTNTSASSDYIDVIEDTIPERVLCSSKANPEPSYEWKFKNRTVSRGSALIINTAMTREDGEFYTCLAFNKHGSHTAKTFINIQYKPSCNITRKEIDDEDTLICTADGNPKETDFQWLYRSENDSVELNKGKVRGDSSYLILEDFSIMRTYRCAVNNSVGLGFCQTEVAGHLAWWQRWDRTTLIILIASIAAVLIAVIIICIIIICICRRKRRQEKYHTDVSISATQSVLSYQPSSPLPASTLQASPEVPKSPPKWPLRPGVLVHVKGDTKQSLCANRLNPATTKASSTTSIIVATIEPHSSLSLEAPASTGQSVQDDANRSIEGLQRTIATVHPSTMILTGTDSGGGDVQDDNRPPTLPRRNILASKNSTNMNDQSANSANELLPKRRKSQNVPSDDDDDNESGIERLQAHSGPTMGGGLFERIFGEIFTKHSKTECDNEKHQRRFFKLFGTANVFRRQRLGRTDSNASNPFASKHRIKGIRCSGSVVTYKKTPVLERPALVDSNSNALLAPSKTAQRSESDSTKQIHAKSSTLRDPLTEPGEYENLPFHGLQTAPNKRAPHTNPFLAGNSSSSGCASGNSQGGGASSSSSSSTVRCQQQQSYHQQQLLVPKELYPSSSMSSQPVIGVAKQTNLCSKGFRQSSATTPATNYNSDNSLTSTNHSKRKTSGYVIRPVKLPLRKHHSFHFQPSQTVAGSKWKNKSNYKQNGGPLVFKPFPSEKSAFKPISPVGNSNCSRTAANDSNVTTPRICGTSLKRHMSNVESYDSTRYTGTSASNPKLNLDEDRNSDDEEIDEIIITQEEDLPSSSSNSTIVGKRLVYADLASLSSNSRLNKNPRTLSHATTNTNESPTDEFDDLTINSDSEQLRRSNRLKPISYPSSREFRNFEELENDDTAILATPKKRATQYATLKFNEPLGPGSFDDDLDYADVDYRSYGPINYKAASIYAFVKKQKNNGALKEVK